MPGLVPASTYYGRGSKKDVDGRDKPTPVRLMLIPSLA